MAAGNEEFARPGPAAIAIVRRQADLPARRVHAVRLAAALCATVLISGCLAVSPPPEHQPLVPTSGRGIAFGQIAVKAGGATVPPANPGADWSGSGLAPRPELRIYLERLAPRGVTLPSVSGTGLFALVL